MALAQLSTLAAYRPAPAAREMSSNEQQSSIRRPQYPALKAYAAILAKSILLRVTIATRYALGVIASFHDPDARELWATGRCKKLPPSLNRQALKKLYILNAALALENLIVPPGNRLERLRGDRKGQHSIRINDKYRICFIWRDGNAHQVEIVDYH